MKQIRESLLGLSVWLMSLGVAQAASEPTESRLTPQLGQGSARFAFDAGHEKGAGNFVQGRLRLALHDLLDPSEGFPGRSQIEFFNFAGRVFPGPPSRFELEALDLVRVFSLTPVTEFNKDFSWRIELGSRRFRDSNCDRCYGANLEGGIGYAVDPWGDLGQQGPVAFFGLLEAGLQYSAGFREGKWRLGAGPAIGLVAGTGAIKGMLKTGYRYLLVSADSSQFQTDAELRWNMSPVFAAGAGLNLQQHELSSLDRWQGILSVYVYY